VATMSCSYVVAMHTEGVIYSRQRYSLTSLMFSLLQATLAHTMHTHVYTYTYTQRESHETICIWSLTFGSRLVVLGD